MGWTGSQHFGLGSRKDFLLKEFNQENNTHKWYLSNLSMKGAVAYCIHWVEDKTTGEKKHEGMVILTEKRKDDRDWIYYKEMGETVLPYYFDAPKSLIKKLNALGEPHNENAKQWRERCLLNAEKSKFKVEVGTVLKFASAMKFRFPRGTVEEDTFTVADWRGKKVFKTKTGELCRITNWKKREYQVVGVQSVQ